jgi:hypothetical protein
MHDSNEVLMKETCRTNRTGTGEDKRLCSLSQLFRQFTGGEILLSGSFFFSALTWAQNLSNQIASIAAAAGSWRQQPYH